MAKASINWRAPKTTLSPTSFRFGTENFAIAGHVEFRGTCKLQRAAGAGPSRTQAGQLACESVITSSDMVNPITGISPNSTLPKRRRSEKPN
jgi:hypothetical protein